MAKSNGLDYIYNSVDYTASNRVMDRGYITKSNVEHLQIANAIGVPTNLAATYKGCFYKSLHIDLSTQQTSPCRLY